MKDKVTGILFFLLAGAAINLGLLLLLYLASIF